MAFVHSKNTLVTLNAKDLSAYTNSTTYNRSADSHEVTTYGKASKVYSGGLKDGTITIGGFYDDTAANGPRAVIRPILGTVVAFIFKPEGTGTGKPQDTVNVLVTAYNESSPVADQIQWTAELQMSDDVTSISQA
jgi:hypothetical protein